MRSGLTAVMLKELKRFFTDRRMVLTAVLLPALLIYLLYSFIGGAMTANLSVSSDYAPTIYSVNLPDSLAAASEAAGLSFEPADPEEVEGLKEHIAAKTVDMLAVFPADFDAEMTAMLGGVSHGEAGETAEIPDIELYYNSTRVESSAVYGQMQSILSAYKEALQPTFSVNATAGRHDLASEEDSTGFLLASLLPMLLMVLLYSGCMTVAPESIAGEKERGTIATLLVTPLKRWELALGKILSLCIVALVSGASSFIGVVLSLPNLLGSGGDGASPVLDSSVYGLSDYLVLLAVILSTVVLFVGLISIVSAYARSIKEANTMAMPLMMVVFLVAASAMFQASSEANLLLYLVPVYNSVQSMVSIFGFSAEPAAIALTVAVNLVVSGACVVVLSRMFESERVVFGR